MNDSIIDNQNSEKPNFLSVAYKWALITSAVMLVEPLIMYFSDPATYHPQKGGMILGLFNLLFILVMLFMANKEFRDKNNQGFLSFGQGYRVSFVTGLIYIVISTLFTFIFFSYVIDFDVMSANIIDNTIKQLKERGLSDKEILEAIERTKKWTSMGNMILFSTIFMLIFISIASLISSALSKRNPKVA